MKFGIFILQFAIVFFAGAQVVRWETLALATSQLPADRAKVSALSVGESRLAGYMVPLEIPDMINATEFLLIPALPVCMHVTPPPPSETIRIKLKRGVPTTNDLLWVVGKLVRKESKTGAYGAALFEMSDPTVELVKEEDLNEVSKILPKQNFVLDCAGRDRFDPVCAGQKSVRPNGKAQKNIGI